MNSHSALQRWSRRAFVLCGFCVPGCGQSQPSQGLELVGELPGKTGLFDISRDGSLLAVHRRAGSMPCKRHRGCRDIVHEVQVVRADSHRPIRLVKMFFGRDTFDRWVIAFVPGTQDLLLRGELIEDPGKSGFLVWNATTDTWRLVPSPLPRFEFVACVDSERVLGAVPDGAGRRKRVVWHLGSGAVSEVATVSLTEDLPLVSALVGDSGGAEYVVRRLCTEITGRIYNAVSIPGGKLAVISGESSRTHEVDQGLRPTFLSLYDLQSGKRVRQTQVLTEERPINRTALIGGAPYTDGRIGNLAYQMARSADGSWVSFSYERHKAANRLLPGILRREPCFAVYRVDGLVGVGLGTHPQETVTDEGWASISPAAGGKLLFSPDGKYLYTTVDATRQWRIG